MSGATRDDDMSRADLGFTKQLVSAAWRDVLGVASLPQDAHFFALGGDSLKAVQVTSRLSQTLGRAIPLRTLFDAPTLERFAADLRDEQTIGGPIAPKHATSPAPTQGALSFSQERMWFMHALASASAAYHVPMAIRLRGAIDVSALRTALQELVERHDVLRTTFIGYSTGVSAHVGSEPLFHFVEASLVRSGADRASSDAIEAYLSEFTNGSFDLEKGPLLRFALVHVGHDEAILLVVGHHIVLDQWSLDIVLRDLAAGYGRLRRGVRQAPAPAASDGQEPECNGAQGRARAAYADYARWHRHWFEQERRAVELDFWKRKLANLEPVVLNADSPRPPMQSFRGAKLRVEFEPRHAAALRQLGAAHRSTLAFVLMTALKVLLYRHTGQTDIAIGVPIANRHLGNAEHLVGTLVNTLVVRTDLSGTPTFLDALRRVRDAALESFEHQDLPFESLVKELQIPRDASRSPLFSVMFNMLNTPLGDVRFDGLQWSRFDFDKKASQFDLTVTIDATHDKSICFEYSQDLFAPATIRRLADHYMHLLRAAIESPTSAISQLAMLDEHETRLLDAWSRGREEPESNTTIVELLRKTCDARPHAVALIVDDHSFTYRDLDRASTRIAHALRERGVRRGTRVGLCLQRSAQLIIGQWAILKCGAAYVPLDPSYPHERLAYMARDARLACLISESTFGERLGAAELQCPLLDVETELARLSEATMPLDEPPVASDPAYVIYTSGSTGQPKGVVVSHAAVVNFLASMTVEPGLDADDRVLAITTLSFDIAVLELLLPWSLGASVVLATQEQVADADALRRLVETHSITLLQATPSTWRMLIDSGWTGSAILRGLVGGEPLSRELAEQLLARCSHVWNMYGPTETTVWSSCWQVTDPRQGISLGQPIRNTRIAVLDEQGKPCPIGVPGEIHIGGAGLAQGYFDRPELTAQRFVLQTLEPSEPPLRLYKTGDRGRWRHDGALEHLGRLDSQVKIRGHRIELGEIESHLSRRSGVKQALVVAKEAAPGDLRLVAYVVPSGGPVDPQELRTQLRESLPAFMLPQAIISLTSLPTLPNGKIDTRRLPVPTTQRDNAGERCVRPRTQTEEELCRIWRDLLQVDHVEVGDNFFDLGGHSILSVRLVARIRVELRRACTLPMIFRYPTVAALAAVLDHAGTLEGSSLIQLQPLGAEPAVYCLCGIQIYQELANRLAPEVPVYGVFVPQELEYLKSATAQMPSVEQLAAEYRRAIQAHQPHGPYRLVGFSFGGVLAYEVAQQLTSAGERVSLLAILDSDVPDRRKAARPGRLEQRLSALKQALSRRLRQRFQQWASDEHLKHARDDKYVIAIRSYVAAKYHGRTVFFRATDEPQYNPGYDWDALVPGLTFYKVPGNHLGILAPPNVDLLAQQLRNHL